MLCLLNIIKSDVKFAANFLEFWWQEEGVSNTTTNLVPIAWLLFVTHTFKTENEFSLIE